MSDQEQQEPEELTAQAGGEEQEPQEPMSEQPEVEGSGVEPLDPEQEQGAMLGGGEQVAGQAAAVGFNPDAPVATSAPPPEWQSGTPELADENVQARPHAEESITDPGSPDPEAPQEGDVASRAAEGEVNAEEAPPAAEEGAQQPPPDEEG